jgi:hypothetical protein
LCEKCLPRREKNANRQKPKKFPRVRLSQIEQL